jgi:F-type H+-transporting ATPase subunit epsilon
MADLYLIISPSKLSKEISFPLQFRNIRGPSGAKNHTFNKYIEIGLLNKESNSTKYFATGGGTVEVLNNNILVLADSLESVEDIDTERAKSARQRAEERLAHKVDIDMARARAALARAINRLSLVEKYTSARI